MTPKIGGVPKKNAASLISFMDTFRAEDTRTINQRINELARESEATLPGDPRREEIAIEISQLQLRLQYLQKKNV
jgi:hypothetical protein